MSGDDFSRCNNCGQLAHCGFLCGSRRRRHECKCDNCLEAARLGNARSALTTPKVERVEDEPDITF